MEGTAYIACKSGQCVACISGYKIVFLNVREYSWFLMQQKKKQ